jgi:hypothetical protein
MFCKKMDNSHSHPTGFFHASPCLPVEYHAIIFNGERRVSGIHPAVQLRIQE